jgi:N-acetylglucosaminylphosphatidylinositol deacetylase
VGRSPSAKPFEAYALLSTPLWRKYAGLADALWSWRDEAQSARTSNGDASVHLVTSFAPWLSHRAMAAHRSQFVWYRRLFVLFSRYTFFNTLQRIESK